MKVNSNICALPGLLPFISLTFRRSSGYCPAQFLSGRSCVLLTAAERLHVSVRWWKSPSAFGQLLWKGRCLCAQVSACWGHWVTGYCPAAGGLHVGSSEAEMIPLGSRVVFCHVNDPCQGGSAAERSSPAARASLSVLKEPPRCRTGALPRGKPSVLHPSLGFGQGVLGEGALL